MWTCRPAFSRGCRRGIGRFHPPAAGGSNARPAAGVIINTSFNIRGEPIVCTPRDACSCFLATDMDVLVLENCLLYKNEQPRQDAQAKQDYLDSFKLD